MGFHLMGQEFVQGDMGPVRRRLGSLESRVRDRVLSGFVLANPPTNTPARLMYSMYRAHVFKYLIRKIILKEISI